MRGIFAALFVLLMTAAAGEANPPSASDVNSVPKIVVSGTGDSQELMRALAKALTEKLDGKCLIEVPDAVGSSVSIKALVKGDIDIARVARPLRKEEQGLGLNYKVFANTAVAFVVNPSVTGIDNITTEQIVDIYSGKIADWSSLGAEPGKIYPLTREPGDSSLRVFSETFPEFTNIPNPVGKVMFLTPETVAALLEHKNTIGFVPYSAIVGTNLKVLKVDGIEPSVEKITGGEYKYLIPLGVVYKGQPEGLVKEFIDFLYSEDAQKIIKEMGAVPVK
ncbi:MAG: substrate-binding domain-containing protein [Phycisphaerae bacterium]|nr:substrate-binding domain-containing protein [Phycisphaerae bacterium]